MVNLSKMLLVSFAIHLTLLMTGIATFSGSSLYLFLVNPTAWEASPFLFQIKALILLVAGGGIIAGAIYKQFDFIIFSGISLVFLSFGLALAELFSVIAAQTNVTFASLFVSPLLIIHVMAVLSFWRGRSD